MTKHLPPDELVYRGIRTLGPGGTPFVRVYADHLPLSATAGRELIDLIDSGLEWGYRGAGPHRLARALILHATGSPGRAIRAMSWFGWAVVSTWGDTWSITAGEVRRWLDQFEDEHISEIAADHPIVVELADDVVTEGGGL